MMKRQWVAGLTGAALVIAVTALSGFADEGQGRKMGGQMQSGHDQGEQDEHSGHYLKHLLKHAKEIGLTPEQIKQLKVLQLDCNRTQARSEADIKIAKLELHALTEEEQADFSAIQAKVEQLKKAEGAFLLAVIKSKRDGMALLTSEQREKDFAHREKMKSGGEAQHRGSKGGGGHGGGEHGSGEQGGGQQHQH
ncbi:MAG: hypothetical protein Q8N04_12000 [Nitrospira sp.]|nr:hypothetical protein [Nitrospira sp.]